MKARWWLVLGATVVIGIGAAYWLPTQLSGTLPVTLLVASDGGQWRNATDSSGAPIRVVVHDNLKWCTCPGLGVVSQLNTDNVDSAFALGHALFRQFADEGSKDPARRCLTVTLEVGSGRHSPWIHPPLYVFSWYLLRDGRWTFKGYAVPTGETHGAFVRSKAWHQAI